MTDRSRHDSGGIDGRTTLSRAVLVVSGSLFLFVGYRLKSGVGPIGDPATVLVVFGFYLLAFGTLFAGVVEEYTAEAHRAAAYGGLALLGFWLLQSAVRFGGTGFGTDALVFSRYSVDILLAGENPYTHSMAPAFDAYPVPSNYVTYQMDGSVVTSFSYPALAFLAFVPQVVAGVPNLNLTTLVVLILVIAFLVWASPPDMAVVPVLLLLVNPDLAFFSAGGVFDVLWVLPVLASMRYWARERYLAGAALLGLAFAVKQIPWTIAPFLGVWIYADSEGVDDFLHRLLPITTIGLAAFLLPNLPFILDSPTAWATRVFTPLGSQGDLVIQGSGLSLLSSMGIVQLPKGFFLFTELVVLGLAVLVYALYFERLKWTAWIFPGVVLWFHFRSLQNYYVFFVPIAYYSLLLSIEEGTPVPVESDV